MIALRDTHVQVVLAYRVLSQFNNYDVTFNFLRHYVQDHFILKME